MKKPAKILSIFVMIFFCFGICSTVYASKFNVLVVMSYENPEKNPWCREIKEGIDSVLGGISKIDYFYMNTKIDYGGGKQKAKEAYALYQKSHYDGVIAADDNAQHMFVVPYLKNVVKTPVMFCGVNAKEKKYGYPASNVSGILERGHFRESVALIKQLMPHIKTVGFIAKDSTSGKALKTHIESNTDAYLAKIVTFELVNTLADIKTIEILKDCDAFLVDSLEGITNHNGKRLSQKEIISFLTDTFAKPVIGANNSHVKSGALCAVVKTGTEQGEGAAEKLLKAMQGTPVSKIPITQNFKGKRVINVTEMSRLSIEPSPLSLLGASLVRTNE